MSKTVLFLTIQFSYLQFNSIQTIERNLSCATTLGQCGPGIEGIEKIPYILQIPVLKEP